MILAAIRIAVYAAAIPPWQGPDEPKHFEYVVLLDRLRRPVGYEDRDPTIQRRIIDSMVEFRFWQYQFKPMPTVEPSTFEQIWPNAPTLLLRAPLFYVFALPAYEVVRSSPIVMQLFVLRLFNGIMFAGTILLTYRATLELLPGQPWIARLAGLVHCLLPQLTAQSAVLSNDGITALVGGAVTLMAIVGVRRGWTGPRLALIASLLLIEFGLKRTAVLLVPLVLLALAIGPWRRGVLRRFVAAVLATIGAVALVGGMLSLVRPALFASMLARLQILVNNLFFDSTTSQLLGIFDSSHYTASALPLYGNLLSFLFQSFWAYLGWAAGRAPDGVYDVLLVVSTVALIGSGAAVLGRRFATCPLAVEARRALAVCWLSIPGAVAGTILYYSLGLSESYLAQGRYLFPVTTPLVIVLTIGLLAMWPARWQRKAGTVIVVSVAAFDLYFLVGLLLPFFYA